MRILGIRACQHDPAGRLGPRLAGLFRIGFQPGEEVSARLEAIDRDPGEIDLIINSHFHFDHVGGNALIPNATMLVQRREWDAGMDPDTAARRGFNPRDFQNALAVAGNRSPCTIQILKIALARHEKDEYHIKIEGVICACAV
jgi:glyoxylase-like metal-dependent hydrolase (beta-lactamase superfamily II)